MVLALAEAISRVPQCAGVNNIISTPLGGGNTNNNFRIDAAGESFVLCIPGADTELLGINRDNEYAANQTTGRLGIAPEVYYFIQPEGYLVTRFVYGQLLPPEEISQPENIRRVMRTVREIHAMHEIPGTFNVFQVVRDYTDIARRYRVAFPNNYDWLIERIQEAEQALSVYPHKPHPGHNDFLNANFLTNGQLYILDWEYAGMGDLFFDLANFSDHHNLIDDQDYWLLNCYFDKKPPPAQWAHLKIMKIMSDLREATCGLVQIGISKLDFDFHEYADKFFGCVMENIHHPKWYEYLKEVSINV
jgi:thiamine kinase-like enzyme